MSAHNTFSWRNKNNINTFGLKKAAFQELCNNTDDISEISLLWKNTNKGYGRPAVSENSTTNTDDSVWENFHNITGRTNNADRQYTEIDSLHNKTRSELKHLFLFVCVEVLRPSQP